MPRLGDKHAAKYGYKKYVGNVITKGTKTHKVGEATLQIVHVEIPNVPFPVPVAVHKEDIIND